MEDDTMVHIHPSWKPLFDAQKIRLCKIKKHLEKLKKAGKVIYPPSECIFKVFTKDLYQIKVVILGQDPYIRPNQAMGLSFSVSSNERIPPSLQNIFKELQDEYPNTYHFTHGDLTRWFEKEHLFLLNAALTVEEGLSGSHMQLWEKFTNNVIRYIADNHPSAIYLFMGNFAKSKKSILPPSAYPNIVSCAHPSPLSAYQGFFKSNVFKSINEKLTTRDTSPICWQN
jgi:uracil-DNA glycosylase